MSSSAINSFAEKALAAGFFFFFSYQIFSPQFGGRTLYLEYFFVVFNPFFWSWVLNTRFDRKALVIVFVALVLVPFYTVTAVKFLVTFLGVTFLVYCYYRRIFMLKRFLAVSVLVALVQFFFLYTGKVDTAKALGPSHIAAMVWGSHATQTFANFYTLYLLPRVSGLSREAGFFASFLIVSLLAIWINKRVVGDALGRSPKVWFALGFLVSFSKISAAIFPALLVIGFRRLMDKIPLFLIGTIFLAVLVAFWNYFQAFLFLSQNGTFLGRFGAYSLLDNLSLMHLLFGVSDLADVNQPLAHILVSYGYHSLFGLGGWVLEYGLISFWLYTVALQALGIRGSGFLIVLLMTATVGIDTNQNFCVLAYYVAFMLPKAGSMFSRVSDPNRRKWFRLTPYPILSR